MRKLFFFSTFVRTKNIESKQYFTSILNAFHFFKIWFEIGQNLNPNKFAKSYRRWLLADKLILQALFGIHLDILRTNEGLRSLTLSSLRISTPFVYSSIRSFCNIKKMQIYVCIFQVCATATSVWKFLNKISIEFPFDFNDLH